MRIIIDMGHTPTSPGASGYLDELYCDREAGKRIIAELERRGHTVFNSTAPDWMAYPEEVNYRVQYEHDVPNIDLFCSIHLNAGGGQGCEVLYYDGDDTGYRFAKRISANISDAIGIRDRGPKPNDWVGVICNTWCTAVLIEYCFVDSWSDAEAWHACPWEDIVNSVCDGIEGKAWSKDDKPEPKPDPEPAPKPDPKPEPEPSDDVRYCVSIDNEGQEWLPEMIGKHDTSGSDDWYAGILGENIKWFAAKGCTYRACTKESGWLPWVSGYNTDDLEYGCAGDGSDITGIEIKNTDIRFSVHTARGWYEDMIGQHDTAGTSDPFGGDLWNPIDAITMTRE